MDLGELKFVLVFVIEDGAVLIDERHDGGLPPWRPQEANDHIEEPVLQIAIRLLRGHLRPPLPP